MGRVSDFANNQHNKKTNTRRDRDTRPWWQARQKVTLAIKMANEKLVVTLRQGQLNRACDSKAVLKYRTWVVEIVVGKVVGKFIVIVAPFK